MSRLFILHCALLVGLARDRAKRGESTRLVTVPFDHLSTTAIRGCRGQVFVCRLFYIISRAYFSLHFYPRVTRYSAKKGDCRCGFGRCSLCSVLYIENFSNFSHFQHRSEGREAVRYHFRVIPELSIPLSTLIGSDRFLTISVCGERVSP